MTAFRHEALFYAGDDEFVDHTAAFISDAVGADEAILIVVAAAKIERLREALGRDADADGVRFADMAAVGRNPARIIPAWTDFVAEQHSKGRPFRGIGEPIWADRSPAELVECERHESLLNLAFAESGGWWLLCPYDTTSLDEDVIATAERNHPVLMAHGHSCESTTYGGLAAAVAPFDTPLPPPPQHAIAVDFASGPFSGLRHLVAAQAAAAGLDDEQAADLQLAVTEIASNSVRHGGGHGSMRVWIEGGDSVVCDVRDNGAIDEPLAGRRRPPVDPDCGRGLWLANQLCDLVQVRSSPEIGTVVRLHLSRR